MSGASLAATGKNAHAAGAASAAAGSASFFFAARRVVSAAALRQPARGSRPLSRASEALLLRRSRATGHSGAHGSPTAVPAPSAPAAPEPEQRHPRPLPGGRFDAAQSSGSTAGVSAQLPGTTVELVERLLACRASVARKSGRGRGRGQKITMPLSESKPSLDPLVWIDCEMTGLDVNKDRIIEIAVVITDGNLNLIASGPELVIHQPKRLMDGMDEWCKKQHRKSGLTEDVMKSTLTTEEAARKVTNFVKQFIPRQGSGILAGNSVHVDKEFLKREMPELIDHLHYRIIDVSTVKELVMRWAPGVAVALPPKDEGHRALADIKESIRELAYYRSTIFHSVLQAPAATGLS